MLVTMSDKELSRINVIQSVVSYSRRKPRVHQPRYRRDCLGELVQIDGSPHEWFDGIFQGQ